VPDAASLAVMRRLGMSFHKDVHYPLGRRGGICAAP
jgi:hypothetical protein